MQNSQYRTASESPREFAFVSGAMTGARAIHAQLLDLLRNLRGERMRPPAEHPEPDMEILTMAADVVRVQTEVLALLAQVREHLGK